MDSDIQNSPSSSPIHSHSEQLSTGNNFRDDGVDLRFLIGRIAAGLHLIIGLALTVAFVATATYWIVGWKAPVTTSTRITFAFPGFERSEYPDGATFQPDDVRAPAVVNEAVERQHLETSPEFLSKIRAGLGIEGIVPAAIVKERDRLRAAGQNPPAYIPDEYIFTLTLPRYFRLNSTQRGNLLKEIISIYLDVFRRTYADTPLEIGTVFTTLRDADFPEYELILNQEFQKINVFLNDQIEKAKSFRSPTTNLSFKELQGQVRLFGEIRLNEVLGVIRENGLSKDRRTAMMKMDYYLKILEGRERDAIEKEKVVRDLLTQSQARNENYLFGLKSQVTQPQNQAPLIDKGLVDSLIANDAYTFLVHRALDAGLEVKKAQAEKAKLIDLRENMKSFINSNAVDQSAALAQAEKSLTYLEKAYLELVNNIRRTQNDFAHQRFGHAVRLSDDVRTEGLLKTLLVAAIAGAAVGATLGIGLSLIGFRQQSTRSNL